MSTVNLVLQQKERFELFLGQKYSVSDISGANSDIPLKYILQNHEVVVLTAQILVNALKEGRELRVNLSDISLLFFDECHHANKEHSYNKIMENYVALKLQPGNRCKLPQVRDGVYLFCFVFVLFCFDLFLVCLFVLFCLFRSVLFVLFCLFCSVLF